MGWKDKFTFRDKRHIEADVAGRSFKFYPNRMSLLTEARDLSAPVAKAVATLFNKNVADNSSTITNQRDGEYEKEDIITDAITEEMAAYRAKERDDAIGALFSVAGDARSQILLGRLFMDSLRDEFPYDPSRPAEDVEEFLFGDNDGYSGIDAPMVVDLFKGWMMANAKVFGPAGEQMVEILRSKAKALASEHLSEMEKTPEASTSGNDLPTPSSVPSDTDSVPST